MHREQDVKTCILLCYFTTEPLNDFWQLSLPLLLHSAYGDYSFMYRASLLSHTRFTLRNFQVQDFTLNLLKIINLERKDNVLSSIKEAKEKMKWKSLCSYAMLRKSLQLRLNYMIWFK